MESNLTLPEWGVLLDPENIGQLLDVAIRVSKQTEKMVLPVGPLSTGGTGSYAKNVTRLRFVVTRLRQVGKLVFDSSVFDESLRDLARQEADTARARSEYVTCNFYVPLLRSGRINSLVCLPDIDGSVGAQIARDVARSLGLPIRQLTEDFFPKRLRSSAVTQ